MVAVMITRRMAVAAGQDAAGGPRPPLLPWFVVVFALLVVVNSFGWIPRPVVTFGNDLSRWCLVASIAGIGMKTHLRELSTVGIKPVLLMIGETVFLAALVLALLRWAQ
jgi:uncharacterized membrane protein YadS